MKRGHAAREGTGPEGEGGGKNEGKAGGRKRGLQAHSKNSDFGTLTSEKARRPDFCKISVFCLLSEKRLIRLTF